MFGFLLSLIVSLKYVSGSPSMSNIITCNASIPVCVVDNPTAGQLIIAGNSIDELIVNCHDCKHDSTAGIKLEIVSYAALTVVNANAKDACIGCCVNIGVTPDGIMADGLSIPSGAGLTALMNCPFESSCKQAKFNVDGDSSLVIEANEKAALESAMIDCGTTTASSCSVSCSNEFDAVCKEYTCSPLSNCVCASIGTSDTPACPTVEPTKEPTLNPVLAPTDNPTISPVPETEEPSTSPTASPPTASTSPTQAPTTPFPTRSPVHETDSPTTPPTASPPTASTSPTQAPTTPFPTRSPVPETEEPSTTPTASPPTASTSPTQAPTTPFPTRSPVPETQPPTGSPTASPPTASTSPTQAPTTPIPTTSPVPETSQPTGSPTATPPPPPLCTPACEGQIGGACVFDGVKEGTFVCPNSFTSCTMNCDDCQSVTLYSGSPITSVNCLTKDSCPSANIYVGSETDITECTNFVASDMSGTKTSASINCGTEPDSEDNGACKDMKVYATGEFTGDITINIDAESGWTKGFLSCDTTDSSGNCIVECFGKDSCKDSIYECLATSSQCSCMGDECPDIDDFGDSPCPSNALLCEFDCVSGERYAIKNDVHKVVINGLTSDRQCEDIIVYSSAKETIFNGGTFETFVNARAFIGSGEAPKGFKSNEFTLLGEANVTGNFDGKASGKDFWIYVYGDVDCEINALDEQAFEDSLLYCDIIPGNKCIKNCLEYDNSCTGSTTVCPNIGSICECNDVFNAIKNSSHTSNAASSCSPTLTEIPVQYLRTSISSNVNNNVFDNKSEPSKIIYVIISLSIVTVFVGAFIMWFTRKSRNPLKTSLNGLQSKSDEYNTFNLEMGNQFN